MTRRYFRSFFQTVVASSFVAMALFLLLPFATMAFTRINVRFFFNFIMSNNYGARLTAGKIMGILIRGRMKLRIFFRYATRLFPTTSIRDNTTCEDICNDRVPIILKNNKKGNGTYIIFRCNFFTLRTNERFAKGDVTNQ